MVDELNAEWGWSLVLHPQWNSVTNESDAPMPNGGGWQSHKIHRTLQHMPLLCPQCSTATLPDQGICPNCLAKLPTTDEEG